MNTSTQTSQDDLKGLKSPRNAVSVYGNYLNLKKQGAEWLALCPFHSEKTPSFKLYESEGVLLYKCFGCQKSGNVFQFVQAISNTGFESAVEKVKSICGWSEGRTQVEKTFKQVSEHKEFITFPVEKIKQAEDFLACRPEADSWLRSRGLSQQISKRFHLGFVQSARMVSPANPNVENGWILFPYLERDKIVCLKYRSVVSKDFVRKMDMETRLYNLDAVEPFDDVFVVEGEIDCLTVAQAGYPCVALPSAGFSPTPEQRDRLLQANTIYLAGDMDAPGQACMKKLWAELKDRTYLIEWPTPCKDANEVFLNHCAGDIEKFKALVENLKSEARKQPIPDFFDLSESIRNADITNPMDDPKRLHFPWKSVDEMAVVRPGALVTSYASLSGTGKTSFWANVQLHEAIHYSSVVVDYSGELSPQEYAELVTAILTGQNRLQLKKEDFELAAKKLMGSRFYVGYNPDVQSIRQILGDDKNPGLLEWAIRRLGANIVVLDHLHFFTSGEKDPVVSDAWAVSRAKNLARKYGLIFVMVGQSRKATPSQRGKVTEQADAKSSETFTSSSNVSYHLHRDVKREIDWEHPETWPSDLLVPQTDIRVYKPRVKGPGKAVTRLWFEGSCGRYAEIVNRSV